MKCASRRTKDPPRGFTLIELVVVIGIIIVLMAVTLAVGVRRTRATAGRAVTRSTARFRAGWSWIVPG